MDKEVILRIHEGANVAAEQIGNLTLYFPNGIRLELNKVRYVPLFHQNVINISSLHENGYRVIFDSIVSYHFR